MSVNSDLKYGFILELKDCDKRLLNYGVLLCTQDNIDCLQEWVERIEASKHLFDPEKGIIEDIAFGEAFEIHEPQFKHFEESFDSLTTRQMTSDEVEFFKNDQLLTQYQIDASIQGIIYKDGSVGLTIKYCWDLYEICTIDLSEIRGD